MISFSEASINADVIDIDVAKNQRPEPGAEVVTSVPEGDAVRAQIVAAIKAKIIGEPSLPFNGAPDRGRQARGCRQP